MIERPGSLASPVVGDLDELRHALQPNAMHVDLDAIAANVGVIRSRIGPGVQLVAALKANAYGFGIGRVAPIVVAAGADAIAVVDLVDAIGIRNAGIELPIVLYGGTRPDPAVVAAVVEHDITVTILDAADVAAYGSAGRPVRAFVKVDTGLERLGTQPADAGALARLVSDHPGLAFAGLYAHMHVPSGPPDDVTAYVEWQFARFGETVAALERAGVRVPLTMAASSGTLRVSDSMNADAVDVGSLLFGLAPPGPELLTFDLRPALISLTSRLTQVRTVHRRDFLAQSPIPTGRPLRLGVIPMGTVHGLFGLSAGHVLVRGRRAAVLGVSLEHARLDLGDIEAEAGDEVVVIGRQGDEEISIVEVARAHALATPAAVPVLVTSAVLRRYVTAGPDAVEA